MPAEIVATEEKYRGWCRLLVAQVRYPDGHIVRREIEDHGRAACVLPYDPARKVATLVRQLRIPVVRAGGPPTLIEAPAGTIDPGEDEVAAARREAEEETGIRLASLEPVAAVWSMPGVSTERLSMFLAPYSEADRIGAGGGDASEDIEVIEMQLRPCRDGGRRNAHRHEGLHADPDAASAAAGLVPLTSS